MTSKLKSKRRWRLIRRYVRRKERRVRVCQLARRFKLAPSNVSRGLKRMGISLEPAAFPWEAGSQSNRKEQAQKRRQALALYFLGLNRRQIERLLPIKSETVRNYILALTIKVNAPLRQPYRMFCDRALGALADELEKAYGLGDHLQDVINSSRFLQGNFLPADAGAFLREFCRYASSSAFLMRKLRRILRRKVCRQGQFIWVDAREDGPVKLCAPSPDWCRHRPGPRSDR